MPPRKATPAELREWLRETARDQLLKTPPELPEEAENAAPTPPKIAAPTGAPPAAARKKQPARAPLAIGETTQLDGNLARRFRQGKLPLDATLDLHGMHKMAALDAVEAFLQQQSARGARHVLIITGKGGREGVLRRAIGEWLNLARLRPLVLAAIHGRQERGGEGALYVLLKKHG